MEIDRGRALLDVLQDSTPVVVILGRMIGQFVLPMGVLVALPIKDEKVGDAFPLELEVVIDVRVPEGSTCRSRTSKKEIALRR